MVKLRLEWLGYQALLLLLTPLALVAAWWLDRRGERGRWLERFGYYRGPLPRTPIWIHAASVGENQAAALLIDALRRQGEPGPFLVTSTTATGAQAIAGALQAGDRHLYAPFDAPWCVRRALRQLAPRMLVVMEVELWPNLWRGCEQRGVPIVLANARLSQRSLLRYRKRLPRLTGATLARASLVLAQSETVAERYRGLGAAAARVRVGGNLKYGIQADPVRQQAGRDLRRLLGEQRPLWLAASTHAGEEALVLDAHRQLLAQHPDALLVLVPRHPQRFDEVAELCAASGLRWARRSTGATEHLGDLQLYLADTLGELLAFYAAADLALVAGSFVSVGGHNILEPAAYGCPILVGPDMRNFEEILAEFLEQQALCQVPDCSALFQALARLLADSQEARAMAERAGALLEAHVHAPENQAWLLLEQLQKAAGKGGVADG